MTSSQVWPVGPVRADIVTDYTARSKKNPITVQNNTKPLQNNVADFNVSRNILEILITHYQLGFNSTAWHTQEDHSFEVCARGTSHSPRRKQFQARD